MSNGWNVLAKGMAIVSCVVAFTVFPHDLFAHCDTLDGPVVTDARKALEKGDVELVLKWIKKEHEGEIREAYAKTLVVRDKGPEARELADMYFFETLVRIHRAGEGAPYTGLKAAGSELSPAVVEADRALERPSVEVLVKMITEKAAEGLRERFHHAVAAKKHADESVEDGREFVEAYIEFVHYAERLYLDATTRAIQHGQPEHPETEGAHDH
jgi:hypothetical protein